MALGDYCKLSEDMALEDLLAPSCISKGKEHLTTYGYYKNYLQ